MTFDVAVIMIVALGILLFIGARWVFEDITTGKAKMSKVIGLWFFFYAVATVAVFAFSPITKPTAPWSDPLEYTYVAAEMGFVSGQNYPLLLGERSGGSAGVTSVTTSLSSGLFSARTTSSMQGSSTPASAVSFGYTYEGKTYILEMPTSRITFVQSDSQEPSVTVWLKDEATFAFGESVYDEYSVSACSWRFHNLIWMCLWPEYSGPNPTPIISQHAMDVGLAPVIMEGFDRATVTLSPDMYRKLLGVIE